MRGRALVWSAIINGRRDQAAAKRPNTQKNTGVLFATKSQLPSAVLNLTEKPRGSLRTAGSARYFGCTSLQRACRSEGEDNYSPSKVRRTRLPADGREADGQRTLGTLLEHVGHADVFEAIGAFPDPVCARAFGVDDSLGNAAVQASATVGDESTLVLTYRSRSKCDNKSMRWKSCRSRGPSTPARWVMYGWGMGTPLVVV